MMTKCRHISDSDLLDQDVVVKSGVDYCAPWSRLSFRSYGWAPLDYWIEIDDVREKYEMYHPSECEDCDFYDTDRNGFCIPVLSFSQERDLLIESILDPEDPIDLSNRIKNYWP